MAGKADWYVNGSGSLVCVAKDGAWIYRDGKWHRQDALRAQVSGHSSASMDFDEVSLQDAEKRFPEAFKVVPG